jgi:hypothetical protein
MIPTKATSRGDLDPSRPSTTNAPERMAAAIAEVRAHGTQQSYGDAGTRASALALI